ncbi:hypothetical protein GQ53DRAFT_848507 [Thozetella sp. PMI_491]|nr:hypothetical protein GQ53DRAFT_848507 [Thozetella sp. PMI_491]
MASRSPNAELPLGETQGRAAQACQQCSRLKRKCQRELPECSLCTRLCKPCVYPTGRKPYGSGKVPNVSSPAAPGDRNVASAPFPDTFFLDGELFHSVPRTTLGVAHPTPLHVSQLLGADVTAICDSYFSSVDTWFPFVSRKRLKQSIEASLPCEASGIALLLLCMRLVVDIPEEGHASAAQSSLYKTAKSFVNAIEDEHPTSFHLFQSTILLALYEAGHGIYPAAYLTAGRAARLGLLRGVHDRKNATQLFRLPPTWTSWEEERRAWWATLILERFINIGPSGLPLATPEPTQGELLPTTDTEWLRGGIGTNLALYVGSVMPESEIGPFARACQASHLLGRVIHHRDSQRDGPNREFALHEALQLHTTLIALDKHLSQPMDEPQDGVPVSTVDVALCTSARYILYHLYACIESEVMEERRGEESVLQAICIDGVKQTINTRLPALARHVLQQGAEHPERSNPLVIQCLYDSASECQWLLKEGDEAVEGTSTTLKLLVDALKLLAERWGVAEKYLELLKSSEDE